MVIVRSHIYSVYRMILFLSASGDRERLFDPHLSLLSFPAFLQSILLVFREPSEPCRALSSYQYIAYPGPSAIPGPKKSDPMPSLSIQGAYGIFLRPSWCLLSPRRRGQL